MKVTTIDSGYRLYEAQGAGLHFVFSPLDASVLGAVEKLTDHSSTEEAMEFASSMIIGDGSPELGHDYPQAGYVVSTWLEELNLDVAAAPSEIVVIRTKAGDVTIVTVGVADSTISESGDDSGDWN